jgi:hypothetical protein
MRATVPLAAALAVAAGLAAALSGAATAAKPTEPQVLFKDLLLKERATTAAIKQRLRSGALFVEPAPTFADITGDGKDDAIVLVLTPGAAGATAAYVFSTDGAPGGTDAKLRMVFRSQSLYRARARARNGALLLDTPVYRRGDDVCCPGRMLQREYTWSASAKRFVRRAVVEYELTGSPAPPPSATAPAPPAAAP